MVTIQKPKNNIVLMDLDMTIIDRKQQLNDDRLKPTITSEFSSLAITNSNAFENASAASGLA